MRDADRVLIGSHGRNNENKSAWTARIPAQRCKVATHTHTHTHIRTYVHRRSTLNPASPTDGGGITNSVD